MKYYKVNKTSDQKQVFIKNENTGKWIITATLIADELFIEKELTRRLKLKKEVNPRFIENHFTVIDCKPKNTFWIFGTRKQKQLTY